MSEGKRANGEKWTRNEVLQTLALYCRIPFGRMDARNAEVRALAGLLGRTANAVALKLVNLASLDPDLQKRGVGGMKNASRLDREVWEEFYGQWDHLASADARRMKDGDDVESLDERPLRATVARQLVAARRGQGYFRSMVLAAYDEKCCITGISAPELLRASHIVPWASNERFRLDPRNGLCVNALHDAAFDRGLVSLSDGLELLVSSSLRDVTPPKVYEEMFDQYAGSQIHLPERFVPLPEVILHHRSNVFRDGAYR